MILLLLTALASASDVYEICVATTQRWSERYQEFQTEQVETYFSFQRLQLIIHEDSFEVERDSRPIIETTKQAHITCWREHKNSELCYNSEDRIFLWEWTKRNGDTYRNVLAACKVNGE